MTGILETPLQSFFWISKEIVLKKTIDSTTVQNRLDVESAIWSLHNHFHMYFNRFIRFKKSSSVVIIFNIYNSSCCIEVVQTAFGYKKAIDSKAILSSTSSLIFDETTKLYISFPVLSDLLNRLFGMLFAAVAKFNVHESH